MTIVLALLALTTYVVLKQNVVRRADTTAVELAESFLATVSAELNDLAKPESAKEAISAAIAEHKFQDVIFVVLDADGAVLGASEPERGRHRGGDSDADLLVNALSVPAVPVTNQFQSVRIAGHYYRRYTREFAIHGRTASLIVLQSLHRQDEFLETLAGTFGIVIPLTLVVAGFGGYLLARRSLAPVVSMSAQARRIGAENLHDRLQIGNPRDELGQLATSFNDLLDRLTKSFEQQRRFVADASHELRTPVAILCGEAGVTLSKPERTQQEYRESLSILEEEATRLKHIVEDLFTLARADAGQYPLALSDFYLDELAAECCKNVRALAAAKQITVRCDADPDLLIRADESLVRRMLMNLLDNAIKYTQARGTVVTRSTASGNGQYLLSVEDSGPGIPEDLQLRIFERFFRVDPARSRGEKDSGGAGLGLAIASWIAEVHGGEIKLSSSPHGSTFAVSLPKMPS